MKKIFQFLFLFFAINSFSQSVNDYKAVIIPMKYDFVNSENQYRLQTLTKVDLEKAGFQAFYTNESIPTEFNDRCTLLYVDVKKESAFLVTKLFVVFKDCNGKEIFKSDIGKSRDKDFQIAYYEALNEAFLSVNNLHYKYNGGKVADGTASQSKITSSSSPAVIAPVAVTPDVSSVPTLVPVVAVSAAAIVPAVVAADNINESKKPEVQSLNLLYAQATANGFQLIDNTPKVIMKVFKTSVATCYIAIKGSLQGVLIAMDNQWFFEYYQKDKLISEKIDVKF